MVITTIVQPSLIELNRFSRQVESFPVSAGQVQEMARRLGAPRRIVDFYRTFAPDRLFKDRDELMASSEQVETLRQDEAHMPREEEKAPEDD